MNKLLVFEAIMTLCGLFMLAVAPRVSLKLKKSVRVVVLLQLSCLGWFLMFKFFYLTELKIYFLEPVSGIERIREEQWALVLARVTEYPGLYNQETGRAVSICRDENDELVDGGFSHEDEFLEMSDGKAVRFSSPFSRVDADWNWHEQNECRFLKKGDQVFVGGFVIPYGDGLSVMNTRFVFRGTLEELRSLSSRLTASHRISLTVSLICLLLLAVTLRVRSAELRA